MTGLVRAEWLKVTTTRMVLGMAVGSLLFTALNVVAVFFSAGTAPGSPTLQDPTVVRGLASAGTSASIFVLILGIMGMTTEFRHMTVTSTFLGEPRRSRVVVAKTAVYALLGVLLAVVNIALATVLTLALLPLKDHAPVDWAVAAQVNAGGVLAFALYGCLGVAVGALVRNQVAAVLGALVWVMLVEALISLFLTSVGRWLPGGAQAALVQSPAFDSGGTVSGENPYLPVWGGALVLLAYAAVFAAAAAATTLRRDIT